MLKNQKCELKKMNLNILTSKEFERHIIEIMKEKYPISMIDAIVLYCDEKNIEIETAAALVSPRMKSKIESEAINLNLMLKRNRLSIKENQTHKKNGSN